MDLVLGLGISGKSALKLLEKKGVKAIGYDDSTPVDFDFSTIDRLVVSPGVSPKHPIYLEAIQRKLPIIGEAELGLLEKRVPVLAVTGTNGKTTTVMLIEYVLNRLGKKTVAMGNIGFPLTEETDAEIIVAELSSFQLETMREKTLFCSTILNITPDHLDRYPNFNAYAEAKNRIIPCSKIYKNLETIFPLVYKGNFSHDRENCKAAFALCQELGVVEKEFLDAMEGFQKPPHRLEWVREKDGIRYYNDSKGTNVDAVIKAVNAMEGKILLIAGGVDKGESYAIWNELFKDRVKHVFAIGEAKVKMKNELNVPVTLLDSLEQAVQSAEKMAKRGDNILLSPGCSSFDQFKNYADRGNQLKALVMR